MTIVAVCGDACTTTSIVLASVWPHESCVLVEADPSGGDLAAWFGMPVEPSLSGAVARIRAGTWDDLAPHVRTVRSLSVLPAPIGAAEATQAVEQSSRSLAGLMSEVDRVAIVDCGALQRTAAIHPYLARAAVRVLVHRQATQSASAAAVRLQRLVDDATVMDSLGGQLIVAVIGSAPYELGQIAELVGASVVDAVVVGLPIDALTAAVLAGRRGVSARRLLRLPLSRGARELAGVVAARIEPALEVGERR